MCMGHGVLGFVLQTFGVNFLQMHLAEELFSRQLTTFFQEGVQINGLVFRRDQGALEVVKGVVNGVDLTVQAHNLRRQRIERQHTLLGGQDRVVLAVCIPQIEFFGFLGQCGESFTVLRRTRFQVAQGAGGVVVRGGERE